MPSSPLTTRLSPLVLTLAALTLSFYAAKLALSPDALVANAQDAIVTPGRAEEAVKLYKEALRLDVTNAYRWADVGQALLEAGHPAEARPYFQRAYALAPRIPPIAIRYTNFELTQNNQREALRSASEVLRAVPDYDAILFSYFDVTVEDPAAIINAIGDQRRAMQSWLLHLININKAPVAAQAWTRITSANFADTPLTTAYVDYLLRNHSFDSALSAWTTYLGDRRGPYPDHNLIFNGTFKTAPLPSQLDWRLASEPDLFDTTRDNEGVRITFQGKANVNYDHCSQTVILPRPGRYSLTVRVHTEGITTNEGVRLAIPDLGIATDPISGTTPWTTLSLDFSIPEPRTVRIAVIRRPSGKFDNKIEGTAQFKDFILVPPTLYVPSRRTSTASRSAVLRRNPVNIAQLEEIACLTRAERLISTLRKAL